MSHVLRSIALVAMAVAFAIAHPAAAQGSAAQTPAIAATGSVTDAANILSAEQKDRLAAKLETLEKTTGHQLRVVTAPTLGGADATAFTQNLANSWGMGGKRVKDSVVLLVAPQERKARIAVVGLDKELPDAVCQQIMNEQMLPLFKAGDLPGAIEAGVDALVARLRK